MRALIFAAALAVPAALASPARAADAEANWQKKCAGCHGKDGRAETNMGKKLKIKDMTTAEWQAKNSDAKINDVITNGVKDTKMKAFAGKLTPDEIGALVQYIRGLKK